MLILIILSAMNCQNSVTRAYIYIKILLATTIIEDFKHGKKKKQKNSKGDEKDFPAP